MKLLAIETSTIACSAAVSVDGEICERFEIAPRQHAELLLPMIGAVLAEAGLSTGQLDALAFGRGPGAFTGLRIAAGVAQGIAFAADIPVVPVSTLAALAQGAAASRARVLAVMDARMQEVYWGMFETGPDGLVQLSGVEQVCAPDDVPVPPGRDWYGVGDGWQAHGDVLRARIGPALTAADPQCWPRAREIAVLGMQGERVPPEQALPVYLRDRVTGNR